MLAPELTTVTDVDRRHTTMTITGPIATADHGAAILTACQQLPDGHGLVVNLSAVTFLTETGVRALRHLAHSITATGRSVAFVCAELILRAELLLGDLDMLAPVLQADEQAFALIDRAA
ncbi:MAG: STAS domain-containing protein [Actinomycetota bacterium]|nr:STAS domain-containing protein [Actinomycetota bacterium]